MLLGHSERRQYFGETDEALRAKLVAAHEAGLRRDPGRRRDANRSARRARRKPSCAASSRPPSAASAAGQAAATTIAYEPVWAIGTGRTATPELAQDAHAFIRGVLRELHGDQAADAVRIQYGGSMKPDNAAGLLAQPDVDGGLIGGASLDVADFAAILRAAAG